MFRKTWSLERSCNGTSLLEIRTMQSNFSFAFPFCIFQPLILRSGFIRSTGRAPHGFPFLRKQVISMMSLYRYIILWYYQDLLNFWKQKTCFSQCELLLFNSGLTNCSTLPSTEIWHQRSQLQIHRLLQTWCFSGHEGRLQTQPTICKRHL